MDFIYCYKKNQQLKFHVKFLDFLIQRCPEPGILFVEKLKHLDYFEIVNEKYTVLIGDVVQYGRNDRVKDKGFFYRIKYEAQSKSVEVHSDYYSFLPIYYIETEDAVLISSSVHCLNMLTSTKTHNEAFMIDIALYNAPLGDQCFFQEVKRLEYGKYIKIDDSGFQAIQERRFSDLLVDKPRSIEDSINEVVDSFIKNCEFYLDKPVNIALTGGFDGRTVTSVAHYCKQEFITFTHGKRGNSDVEVPVDISHRLGIPHQFIELGNEYVKNHYYQVAEEYLKLSGGMNGFLYPHTLYDFRYLSENGRPVITGYCGSELLRNAHFGGAISSQTLIDFLQSGYDTAMNRVIGNPIFAPLRRIMNLDYTVCERIYHLDTIVKNYPAGLGKNEQLAMFEFEEILPKLFGTWVYSGLHYSRVRVPYMDPDFVSFISQTKVSQFYRKFMEQNPYKRYYGQLLYAKIMAKTWPDLNKQISNKGYAPVDLLSARGIFRIVFGFSRKKKINKVEGFDNLGLVSGLKQVLTLRPMIKETLALDEFVVSSLMKKERIRDLCLLASSCVCYSELISSKT